MKPLIIMILCLSKVYQTIASEISQIHFGNLYNEALEMEDYIIAIRRSLHQHPETRFEEHETSQIIKSVLSIGFKPTYTIPTNIDYMNEENNISYTGGWCIDYFNNDRGGTGVVADIGTGESPCVILRADIDALPVLEKTDVPFKSTHDGKMHACGHDAHTTMLLGAGILLKSHEDKMKGTVRLMFTPAEEGGGGVKLMLEEGAHLIHPQGQRAFAMHVMHYLPTGVIATKPNSITGGVDHLIIKVFGKGGHSALPHMAIDPIPAALAIVRGIYDIYARETYYSEANSGLIGITHFECGSGQNDVIPDEVVIGGTVQALRTSTLSKLKKRIKQIVENIAIAYGCTATLTHRNIPYNALVNDPEVFKFYKKAAASASASGQVTELLEATYFGDDFAFFNDLFPSLYSIIGIGSGGNSTDHPPTNISVHNPNFCLDEAVLARGSATHAHVAIQSIQDMIDTKA